MRGPARDPLFARAQANALERALWRQRAAQGGYLFFSVEHCRGFAREAEQKVQRLAGLAIHAAQLRVGGQA